MFDPRPNDDRGEIAAQDGPEPDRDVLGPAAPRRPAPPRADQHPFGHGGQQIQVAIDDRRAGKRRAQFARRGRPARRRRRGGPRPPAPTWCWSPCTWPPIVPSVAGSRRDQTQLPQPGRRHDRDRILVREAGVAEAVVLFGRARLAHRRVQALERQVAERIGADVAADLVVRIATRRSARRATACRCRSGRARSWAAS